MSETATTATTATAAATSDAAAETAATETKPPAYYQSMWDDANPGKFKAKYQESLPEEFEDRKDLLAQFDSFDSITRALKDNMTAARAKGWIKPLDDKSTPDDIAKFHRDMGIPETPYELKKPEKLPEGVVWKDDRMKAFGAWAKENHLTPKQVESAAALHMQYLAEDHAAFTAQQKGEMERNLAEEKRVLQLTFGGTLGTVITKAQRVAIMPEYDIPAAALDPDSPNFLGPKMLKILSDIADLRGESRIPTAAAVQNYHHDPLREMTAIQTDPGHPMHAAYAKGDARALARVTELQEEAARIRMERKRAS